MGGADLIASFLFSFFIFSLLEADALSACEQQRHRVNVNCIKLCANQKCKAKKKKEGGYKIKISEGKTFYYYYYYHFYHYCNGIEERTNGQNHNIFFPLIFHFILRYID
ncbi:hypothetical protein, unlikely [Trypanosoma brucei gambiense DAL972]|uniref:T. brucei spp.-specific protein n=1 Tax=Trypanosoma brucei gambiense (strain MHOM/CI/86/DAL972) TaxID=679716 RepID=C9ZLM0_TRYB9|nr:hypothetical protein, unlikely [Trypanosoma brucei gambiense DAL972]CBH10229.1 hypothetical protein, unlikely [Trypanosoma brucei gambiense DAL972]|eukprot:XP_011772519.1 hypothetical protein, unlikely [Trypanosoma brucei gambiense DAL972]